MQAELQQTTAPVGRAGVLRLVKLKRGAVYAEEQMILGGRVRRGKPLCRCGQVTLLRRAMARQNKADLIGEGKTHKERLAFVGSFGLRWRMF